MCKNRELRVNNGVKSYYKLSFCIKLNRLVHNQYTCDLFDSKPIQVKVKPEKVKVEEDKTIQYITIYKSRKDILRDGFISVGFDSRYIKRIFKNNIKTLSIKHCFNCDIERMELFDHIRHIGKGYKIHLNNYRDETKSNLSPFKKRDAKFGTKAICTNEFVHKYSRINIQPEDVIVFTDTITKSDTRKHIFINNNYSMSMSSEEFYKHFEEMK